MTEFTTTARKTRRKSYAARTGQDDRAGRILVRAMFGDEKPEFTEDANGNRVRVWKQHEMIRFTNSDLKAALSNRVAVEEAELLTVVPPSAIKYCV